MTFEFTIQRLQDGIPLTGDEIERVLLKEIEDSNGTSREAIWSSRRIPIPKTIAGDLIRVQVLDTFAPTLAGVLVADQEVVLAAAPQSSSFGLSIRMIDAITERT